MIGAILLLIFFFFIYSEDKKEAEKNMPQKESESAETIQTALSEDTPAGAGEDMKNAGTTDTGAGSGSGGQRLDRYVSYALEQTRSSIQNWLEQGLVMVNGRCEGKNYRLREKDRITIANARTGTMRGSGRRNSAGHHL